MLLKMSVVPPFVSEVVGVTKDVCWLCETQANEKSTNHTFHSSVTIPGSLSSSGA